MSFSVSFCLVPTFLFFCLVGLLFVYFCFWVFVAVLLVCVCISWVGVAVIVLYLFLKEGQKGCRVGWMGRWKGSGEDW